MVFDKMPSHAASRFNGLSVLDEDEGEDEDEDERMVLLFKRRKCKWKNVKNVSFLGSLIHWYGILIIQDARTGCYHFNHSSIKCNIINTIYVPASFSQLPKSALCT
jgi:hypothetical protein